MPLVGKTTEWKEVPHERGTRFEFRELSGIERDEAIQAATQRALESVRGLDLAALQGLRRDEVSEDERRETSYDAWTLIRYALVGWSYDEPCDDANKRLLNPPTWDWARETIIEMNTRTEAEKKGSGEISLVESSPPSSAEPTN